MQKINNEIDWQIENISLIILTKVNQLRDLNLKYADIFLQLNDKSKKLVLERSNELKESIQLFEDRLLSLKATRG